MTNQQYFTVKDVATTLNVPQHTIRRFCNSGLIPHVRRNHNGYRILESWQIDLLHIFINMKRAGFKPNDLKRYSDLVRQGAPTKTERIAMLQTRKRQLWQEIATLQTAIDFIERQETILSE